MSRLHEMKKESQRERGLLERVKDRLMEPAKPTPKERVKAMSIHELAKAAKEQKRRQK